MASSAIAYNLTTHELLAGILSFSETQRFGRQALLSYLMSIASKYKALNYFDIKNFDNKLRSRLVENYLNNYEIYKVLYVRAPNPVPQFYEIPTTSKKTLESDLIGRNLSEKEIKFLKDLGYGFDEFVHKN